MKFAVVCAGGIGDALLMQIASHHLQKLQVDVTTFSNHLPALHEWFPKFHFTPQPSIDQIEELFAPFDAIVLQHDNTPKAKRIRSLPKPVYTLYGSHLISKHGPLRPHLDVKFDPELSMADNIRVAAQTLFPARATLVNGFTPLSGLVHRRHARRIAIHPTSTLPAKNWLKASFLELRDKLAKEGWDPVFVAPPEEAQEWGSPLFPTLSELAAFLYESAFFIGNDSGPGHLASNGGIPTLTIGPSLAHLTLWRPGWHPGVIVHPPRWAHQFKLAKENWRFFISVNHIIKQFKKLTAIK
ncbi:MAG: hypothetical protein KGJ02_05910 [Verrucomicrobiota bacterium]|nr:hypothetical protein [Verrucomicrobiota bacterium]